DLGALSTRNLPATHVLYADQVNTYDVMLSDDVVFTADALEDFVAQATLALPTSTFATAKAAAPAAEEAPFGEGSAAPLAAGSAPEGFAIKAKQDSKKFHTPASPWYGRTKAEVWFASEEAAKAAGFVNAVKESTPADEAAQEESK